MTRDLGLARILYTLDDAAHQLSVSKRTVETLVRDGKLESVMVGSRRLVPHDALLEYVAKLRKSA